MPSTNTRKVIASTVMILGSLMKVGIGTFAIGWSMRAGLALLCGCVARHAFDERDQFCFARRS